MYSRDLELRHCKPNDLHALAVILDDRNCWRTLMEVIPKCLNAVESSADGCLDWEKTTANGGLKYNHDHIMQIEIACRRPGETRLYAEILFQEWATSGRRHERPTVGVLLQLLMHAELFRAADFVAEKFLNEPKPPRPKNGPGEPINISLSDDDFDDIKTMVEDSSYYPETAALNDNANIANSLAAENNKDYYTKYQRVDKQVMPPNTPMAINESADAAAAPKPPPRMLRSARLQKQLLKQQQTETRASAASTAEVSNETSIDIREPVAASLALQQQRPQSHFHNGIDMPSAATNSSNAAQSSMVPKFSTLLSSAATDDDTSAQSRNTESTLLSEAPIPLISILANTTMSTNTTKTTKTEIKPAAAFTDANAVVPMIDSEILPKVSALNINGDREIPAAAESFYESSTINPTNSSSSSSSSSDRSSSLSNDESEDDDNDIDIELPGVLQHNDGGVNRNNEVVNYDDEDNSMPMLSILDQRSSNNDSSLTTVTGTSGENSFELSLNDNGSSASNENIPCLSALKQ